MNKEIERKFLVKEEFWKWLFSQKDIQIKRIEIDQSYLSYNPEIRVRRIIRENKEWIKKACITIKSNNENLIRDEFEYSIPFEDASKIWGSHNNFAVGKDRYVFRYKGKTWEVDSFNGFNSGLSIAEIELGSEDEEFELPPGIGEEVTEDERYYNSYLSKNPYRDWSKGK